MQTARTFAKPRPRPQPVAAPPSPLRSALRALSNPYVGASVAGGLFLACAGALVLLTGDPKAGTPVVRLSLARITETRAPPGWRAALPTETPGEAPFDSATVELSSTSPDLDSPAAAGGQAIITISGDSHMDGAQSAALALAQAPLAGLFVQGPAGPLPVIASDGRTPAQSYARPAAAAGKPEVALVIGGLGLNAKATHEAIDSLPPEVTLSFVPYAEGLQGWIDTARAAGHEVLLEAPMEPKDYPDNDPGPYTLMAAGQPAETTRRLEWLLSRATGYFGVTNYLGSKFLQSPVAMGILTDDLRQRGLAFVDDGSAARIGGGLPRASADRIVDDQLDGPAIEAQLGALETQASRAGKALGSGFAYPVTLETAARWASGLAQRGYQLVPASALLVRR
ncbi:MAG: divergent polysaccharide deacetylase family protein [Caulobacteraceae bacterium]|nr:divergent polysaccharide deacetylase family protein [Caulobacteraceae bacterium]